MTLPRSLPPPLPPPRAQVARTLQGAAATAAAVPHPTSAARPNALTSPAASSMGIDSADSGLVTLPPAFLEALRKVVPKRRRAKLPYIIGVGLLAVVGVVGADRSTREFIAERWRHAPVDVPKAATLPPTEAATADRTVPQTTTIDQGVENPVAAAASAKESPPMTESPPGAASATQKKKRPHRAAPQAKEKRTSTGS